MRLTKSKYTLKRKHQVELSCPRSVPHDAIVLDGCVKLCVIHLPDHILVQDYIRFMIHTCSLIGNMIIA